MAFRSLLSKHCRKNTFSNVLIQRTTFVFTRCFPDSWKCVGKIKLDNFVKHFTIWCQHSVYLWETAEAFHISRKFDPVPLSIRNNDKLAATSFHCFLRGELSLDTTWFILFLSAIWNHIHGTLIHTITCKCVCLCVIHVDPVVRSSHKFLQLTIIVLLS